MIYFSFRYENISRVLEKKKISEYEKWRERLVKQEMLTPSGKLYYSDVQYSV